MELFWSLSLHKQYGKYKFPNKCSILNLLIIPLACYKTESAKENEGHISYNIKKSIQLGMNPISAVKMATYNAAKTYGLNDIGVLEEGKDADIVILDSLESVEVHSVYKQGRIVNTEFFTKEAKPVNESMLHTVVLKNISKDKIQVKAEGKIPVIGMIPGQIVTKFLQEDILSVTKGR